jgi:hypothetical protein
VCKCTPAEVRADTKAKNDATFVQVTKYPKLMGVFSAEALCGMVEFHSDAAHGWLKVPWELVEPFADKVSEYSYRDSKSLKQAAKDGETVYVYLEEDCDMALFVAHYALDSDVFNKLVKDVDDGSQSPIRRKPGFKTVNVLDMVR